MAPLLEVILKSSIITSFVPRNVVHDCRQPLRVQYMRGVITFCYIKSSSDCVSYALSYVLIISSLRSLFNVFLLFVFRIIEIKRRRTSPNVGRKVSSGCRIKGKTSWFLKNNPSFKILLLFCLFHIVKSGQPTNNKIAPKIGNSGPMIARHVTVAVNF